MKKAVTITRRSLQWVRKYLELLFWIAALIVLFMLREGSAETSICPVSLLGFGHCPGCGIGHAIHYALRLHFSDSFRHHPFGIPAVIIIFMRIYRLLHQTNRPYET
jgi:hypothetical protein